MVPLLLSLALASPAPVVPGGAAAPGAWAALADGELWVCWSDGESNCFRRVPPPVQSPAPISLRAVQLAFVDRATLVIGVEGVARWELSRGEMTPRPAQARPDAPPLRRPGPAPCGRGPAPRFAEGRWMWGPNPCRAGLTCLRPTPLPPLRRPLALRLRLWVELDTRWDVIAAPDLRRQRRLALTAGIQLGFDPWSQGRLARQHRDLVRARTPTSLNLAADDPHTLHALRAALCAPGSP